MNKRILCKSCWNELDHIELCWYNQNEYIETDLDICDNCFFDFNNFILEKYGKQLFDEHLEKIEFEIFSKLKR